MEPARAREDSAVDISILLGAEDDLIDEREVLRQRGIQKIAAQQQPTRHVSNGMGYIEVMWDFRGCYPLLVSRDTSGSQLVRMIAEKTGIPSEQQRLAYKDKLFRSSDTLKQHGIEPLYSTTNRPRLKLSRLEGLCFRGADLDFWVLVSTRAIERTSRKQVHACRSTRLSEIAEALLPRDCNLPYRVLAQGKVVHDSSKDFWACSEDETSSFGGTIGTIGVQSGDVLRLQLLTSDHERISSIASTASTRSSRSSISSAATSPAILARMHSQCTESPRPEKKPSVLRRVFTS